MSDPEEDRFSDDLQCWDCGATEFNLQMRNHSVGVAICTGCGGRLEVASLYRPEPTDKEEYYMEMQ